MYVFNHHYSIEIFFTSLLLYCYLLYTRTFCVSLFNYIKINFYILARSPVFTHLNATLNGLTTIRAYCAQDILKDEFDKLQDVHTSTTYMFIVTSTAFGFSLDIFCFIFTSLVTFSFLLLNECKNQFPLLTMCRKK